MTTATVGNPCSEKLFETAQERMPGGVNSPVRAFRSVGGTPIFMDRAQGPYVWDADGKQYIDYVGSWGPMILGHANPAVVQRVQTLAANGTSFGAPTALENELAQLVIEAVPSIECVRFVNSGTEAVMSAIRLARAVTQRDKLIKFEGCYHGHADDLLVKAGSGASTLGVPDSPGVPQGATANTLIATYNDLSSVESLLKAHGADVAAILVEPVAGNMGCILPKPGFLEGLRQLADEYGALLVFDEVMSGFRVAYGGAQSHYNVMPDITTLGKVVGGGLPVGAYGASKPIMAHVAPAGPMYQAGTLSGNPLAMGAGIETLKQLQLPGVYEQLHQQTQRLTEGMQRIAREHQISVDVTQIGSMFSLFFSEQPVTQYGDVLQCNKDRFNQYFHHMLAAGVYLAPSAFESGFVSLTHTDDVIDATLEHMTSAFAAL